MDAICTDEDMLIGGIEGTWECPVCCSKQKYKAGYIGHKCYGCNNIFSLEEWRGNIVKMRREKLKLTRPQMARRLQMSPHMVKHYEYIECPDWYYEATAKLIQEMTA